MWEQGERPGYGAGIALRRVGCGVGLALGLAGCGNSTSSRQATGGTGTAASGADAGGTAASGADGGGMAAAPCPEALPLHQPSGTRVELTFAPTLGGKPLLISEPNQLTEGTVTPSNARFYVSELSLLKDDGSSLPVDLLDADGKPEAYGIHLVNLEEPASLTIRTLAPAGNYDGATFTWGINDACNASSGLGAPLSFDSQMKWQHVAGFLFLRYEGQWAANPAATGALGPPPMIHMGGLVGSIMAPKAHIAGTLTVPASGNVTRRIEMSFDQVFAGASSSEDVSDLPAFFQTPEVIAGERLRRGASTLSVFALLGPENG
jgi:hypothetical protein